MHENVFAVTLSVFVLTENDVIEIWNIDNDAYHVLGLVSGDGYVSLTRFVQVCFLWGKWPPFICNKMYIPPYLICKKYALRCFTNNKSQL